MPLEIVGTLKILLIKEPSDPIFIWLFVQRVPLRVILFWVIIELAENPQPEIVILELTYP
jgi:hypothetical protein